MNILGKNVNSKTYHYQNLYKLHGGNDTLMTNVEMRLHIVKREIAVKQMWPQDLGDKKLKAKSICKKLVAELQALAEVSRMFRKKLQMNGMLTHIRHVLKREHAFLKQLPVRATSLQNLKNDVEKYFGI